MLFNLRTILGRDSSVDYSSSHRGREAAKARDFSLSRRQKTERKRHTGQERAKEEVTFYERALSFICHLHSIVGDPSTSSALAIQTNEWMSQGPPLS